MLEVSTQSATSDLTEAWCGALDDNEAGFQGVDICKRCFLCAGKTQVEPCRQSKLSRLAGLVWRMKNGRGEKDAVMVLFWMPA